MVTIVLVSGVPIYKNYLFTSGLKFRTVCLIVDHNIVLIELQGKEDIQAKHLPYIESLFSFA